MFAPSVRIVFDPYFWIQSDPHVGTIVPKCWHDHHYNFHIRVRKSEKARWLCSCSRTVQVKVKLQFNSGGRSKRLYRVRSGKI